MTDVCIDTWNELHEVLYEQSWREDLRRFRARHVLRGMSNANYDLRASLMRLGGKPQERENDILRAFRKYAHSESLPGDSVWNWLALAQHHGLPTRLLDWTYSPYVAMHFVTESMNTYDTDGVIWSIDFAKTNTLLPKKLQTILADEGSDVFSAEMLSRAAANLAEFDQLSDQPFIVFFEPPSLDARIVNQYALFSLISDPDIYMDQWLLEHPEVYRRIIIPACLKWEIRDKLDQANITERVLYPGLDGLTRWLKRYYTLRPQNAQPIEVDRSRTGQPLP